MTISKRILEIINELNITRYDLAKSLDLAPQSVYGWFNEKKPTTPSLDNLVKFLEIYDISPLQFIKGFHLPEITENQQELFDKWLRITKDQKNIVMQLINEFLKEN